VLREAPKTGPTRISRIRRFALPNLTLARAASRSVKLLHERVRVTPGEPQKASRLRRHIEPGPSFGVFDFDNPQVRIEGNLALKPLVRVHGIDPFRLVGARKDPFDAALRVRRRRLGRGTVQRRTTVPQINLDEDCSRFRRAAATQNCARPFGSASAQIGGNPYV